MKSNHSSKKNFIQQLSQFKKEFLKHAKERASEEGGYVDEKTFEIEVANRYLTMRVECYNSDDDCFAINGEIEPIGDEIYQTSYNWYTTNEDW